MSGLAEGVPPHVRSRQGSPLCPRCGCEVIRDVLQPRHTPEGARVSARIWPALPTWRCVECGCIQPRLE